MQSRNRSHFKNEKHINDILHAVSWCRKCVRNCRRPELKQPLHAVTNYYLWFPGISSYFQKDYTSTCWQLFLKSPIEQERGTLPICMSDTAQIGVKDWYYDRNCSISSPVFSSFAVSKMDWRSRSFSMRAHTIMPSSKSHRSSWGRHENGSACIDAREDLLTKAALRLERTRPNGRIIAMALTVRYSLLQSGPNNRASLRASVYRTRVNWDCLLSHEHSTILSFA